MPLSLSFLESRKRLQNPDNTAKKELTSATDGLDEFFDVTATPAMSDMSESSKKSPLELTVSQAASALGISERTLWRKIEAGELKSRLKGKKRLVKIPVSQLPALPTIHAQFEDRISTDDIGAVIDFKSIVTQLNAANYRIGWLESQLAAKEEQLRLLPDLQSKAIEASLLQAKLEQAEQEVNDLRRTWFSRLLSWCLRK